jgi:hypothetical protein
MERAPTTVPLGSPLRSLRRNRPNVCADVEGDWIINKKRRAKPGGTHNHKQMFLIVGHLATPLSRAAPPATRPPMADRWLAHQDRFLWSSRSASFSPVRTGFRPLQRDRKLPTPESSAELDPKQVSATHAARNSLAHHIERPQRTGSVYYD